MEEEEEEEEEEKEEEEEIFTFVPNFVFLNFCILFT